MMLTRRELFRGAAAAPAMPLLDPVRAVAAEVKRVRITDIESFRVHVPGGGAGDQMKNFAYGVSRVRTDAGVCELPRSLSGNPAFTRGDACSIPAPRLITC